MHNSLVDENVIYVLRSLSKYNQLLIFTQIYYILLYNLLGYILLKASAFRMLIEVDELTRDEQRIALGNLQSGLRSLRQDYIEAKDSHEQICQHEGVDTIVFDEEQEVEEELLRLGEIVHSLETDVGVENAKFETTIRVPFQDARHGEKPHATQNSSGMLAKDSGISVNSRQSISEEGTHENAETESRDSSILPSRRPPSIGSAAGAAGVDQELHTLNKDYSRLMDRYRQLRQQPRNSSTEQELADVIQVREYSCSSLIKLPYLVRNYGHSGNVAFGMEKKIHQYK